MTRRSRQPKTPPKEHTTIGTLHELALILLEKFDLDDTDPVVLNGIEKMLSDLLRTRKDFEFGKEDIWCLIDVYVARERGMKPPVQ
jgi:hypothetical protein